MRTRTLPLLLLAAVALALTACGQKVNPRDFDDPPISMPGTTPGTTPRTVTTSVPGSVPGSLPRTTTTTKAPPSTSTSRPTNTSTTRPTTTITSPATTTTVGTADREVQLRELEAHEKAWQAKRPASYAMTLGVGCFCPTSVTGPWRITVAGDTREIVPAEPGGEQPMTGQSAPPDIDELFTYTRRAIAEADHVEVVYDPTWGFPARVSVDEIRQAVDDEQSYTVSDFTPR